MTTTISAEQIKFAHDAFIANYKSFPVALSALLKALPGLHIPTLAALAASHTEAPPKAILLPPSSG